MYITLASNTLFVLNTNRKLLKITYRIKGSSFWTVLKINVHMEQDGFKK